MKKGIILTSIKNLFFFSLFFSGFTLVKGQNELEPEMKDIFKGVFPQVITFRGEYINATNSDYTSWVEGNLPSDGVFKKYVNWDEMDRVNLETQQWATTFAETYPEKLMLLHWDAREHRNDQPGISDKYSPGHWLSFPGSYLANPVSEWETSIDVENGNLFNTKYPNGSFRYPVVLIIELDGDGNRLWEKSEFAEIKSISGNTLNVTRGTALSKPRSFPSGAYVAPMSTRLGNPGLFDYNFSTLCPEKNGKKAYDVLLEEILSLFREGGSLEALDGIAFDVLQYEPRNGNIDTDNDGISDGGFIDGVNYFQKGALKFQQALRDSLGDQYIITGDSYNQHNQRAPHLFNGMESEGLIEHNDAYRGFSKSINIFTFWKNNSRLPYKVNYIVSKFENDADKNNEVALRRLAFGTATCLGIAMTRSQGSPIMDESNGGILNQQHWLGKPLGEMIQLAKSAPDLFNGAGEVMSEDFINKISTTNCVITKSGNTLIAGSDSPNPNANMILEFKNLNLGAYDEDLTFYFEAEDAGLYYELPKTISAHVNGLPSYEGSSQNNQMYNELWGYYSKLRTPISLYYRKAGGRNIDLRLEFEGQGYVKIRNFTVHSKPQVLAREFEGGVVLVNPSLENYTFSLNELFPENTLTKLDGISDPLYNTGETIAENVMVPSLNALFLKKDGSVSVKIQETNTNPKVWYSKLNDSIIFKNIDPGSEILIFNYSGQKFGSFKMEGNHLTYSAGILNTGIYIAKIVNGRESFSTKIYLP